MVCQQDPLVRTICDLYQKISALDSLKPCKDVNALFSQLVNTCIPPNPIDVDNLCSKVKEIRGKLIRLCGEAEGHLESHFAAVLATFERPLSHVSLFPYYDNYLELSRLEYNILSEHCPKPPSKVAFIGSGPLPLTTIVLATNHLTTTIFHNYDINATANSQAEALVLPDPDLSKRVMFYTADVMDITTKMKEYDVVFLAALVGMDKEEKNRFIAHVSKHMAPGTLLMLRSAHGARAFLYPVVDPTDLLGFEVLTVFHPTTDVVNSVVLARKNPNPSTMMFESNGNKKTMPMPNKKCCEIAPLVDPLNQYIHFTDEISIEGKAI